MILLFVLVGVAGGLAALFTVWQWAGAARSGWTGLTFDTSFEAKGFHLTVRRVDPLSPAERAGIREMDRVEAIGGIPVGDAAAQRELRDRQRTGDDVAFSLRRGDRAWTATLRLENPLTQWLRLLDIGLNVVAGLIFLGIGGFVFWKRPGDDRTLLFFILCALYGLLRLLVAGPVYVYSLPVQENLVILALMLGLVSFLFPPLLHFCLIFPRRRPAIERHPALPGWIYGIPVFLGLATMSLLAAGAVLQELSGAQNQQIQAALRGMIERLTEYLRSEPWIPAGVFLALFVPAAALIRRWWKILRAEGLSRGVLGHPWRFVAAAAVLPLWTGAALGLLRYFLGWGDAAGIWILLGLVLVYGLFFAGGQAIQWLVFPVAACVALIRSYRQAGLEERQQIRWPLWGILTAVAGFFLSQPLVNLALFVFGVRRGSPFFPPLWFLRENLDTLFLVLIPLGLAFAILKFKLMEITVYIRRTLVYGILTAMLGLMFLVLIGGLGGLLVRLTGVRNEWVAIGATLVAVLTVVPLRNRVQAAVERRFFRRRHDYAATLQILSREVAASGEIQRLLQVVVDRLQEALQVRAVVFFLRREGDSTFRATAKVGLPDERLGSLKIPVDGGLASRLDAVRPADPAGLPEEERRTLAGAGAALLVPVRHRGELRALLTLGQKLSDLAFDQQDTDFLSAAAGQVAIGLENLRLEEQQREFERAREIQQGLLPQEVPQAPGFQIAGAWQPARSVGGDYYDIFPLGEGRLALVIADVSGKGLAAALLMSNLQAAVRAFAAETATPAELCARVNRMISGHITAGRFITFFYAILDTRARRLAYANAGHNPPLLRGADGQVRPLDRGGTVLGLFRDSAYEQEVIGLRSGDRLLLFTDGLSEAANAAEEEFGEERLAAQLGAFGNAGAEEIKDGLLRAVSDFCGGSFRDDATLIVIRVE